MALLKCPECGKMVSDKATACPQCGCPIEDIKKAAQKEGPAQKEESAEQKTDPGAPVKKPGRKKRVIALIVAAAVIIAAVFGVRGIMRYRSAHASQLLHDWTFISLVYTEDGKQQDALDTTSFTSAGQEAPTLTVNKDGTYTLTALGNEYSGKWTRYSDSDVAKLSGVKQAYNLENSQGLQITAMIQDDAVGDDNTADAVTVVLTEAGTESADSASSGSTQAASSDDFYAFLFERTGN